MNRFFTALLTVTAALTLSAAAHADAAFQPNARDIPETLPHIPEAYAQPSSQAGQLVRLDYDTWESFTYDEHSQRLTKTAWVYLPYGYTPDERYNIFYYMHGGWSNETSTLGTDAQPTPFKHAIDHAIQDGLMQPMIIVCPTCNNTSGEDSGNYSLALQLTDRYHNELVNDLMPAVESRFSTWAEATTPEGLRASRDYRGFGGFSMGSVTTWHTFQYCLDSFRYFMPMSGNMGDSGWLRRRCGHPSGRRRTSSSSPPPARRTSRARRSPCRLTAWPPDTAMCSAWLITSGTATCPSASGRAVPTVAGTPWMTALRSCAGSGMTTDIGRTRHIGRHTARYALFFVRGQ